jgi:hypothetical protein
MSSTRDKSTLFHAQQRQIRMRAYIALSGKIYSRESRTKEKSAAKVVTLFSQELILFSYRSRILKKYSTSSWASSGKSVQWTAFWTLFLPNSARSVRGRKCLAISWKKKKNGHVQMNTLSIE